MDWLIKLDESKNGWIKLYYDKIDKSYLVAETLNHKYNWFKTITEARKYFERTSR